MIVYLKDKNCIAMFQQKANSSFWDHLWETDSLQLLITSYPDNPFIMNPLRKYLPNEKGIILEGGCGQGHNVYTMKVNGYNAVGLDFAEKTVQAVNNAVPELDVRKGDVRRLPFADGEIAGYWSLGVIEHFWAGYGEIIGEMSRVIRKGGFLFLTFPYMSPIRKLKAQLKLYPMDFDSQIIDRFYQFCLDDNRVIADLQKLGFQLREKAPFDGIGGFRKEVPLVRPFLARIGQGEINSRIGRKLIYVLDRLMEKLGGHCILLVMEKVR